MCVKKDDDNKFRRLYTSDGNKPRLLKSERKGLIHKL